MRLVMAAEGATGPAEPSLIAAKRTLLLPRGVSFDAVAAAERQLGVGEARARVMEVRLTTSPGLALRSERFPRASYSAHLHSPPVDTSRGFGLGLAKYL